jgi:tellurite resistance protein TerC
MLAVIEITPLHWAGFILAVLFFLALDLGVFHRKAHVVKFKEALGWTTLWVTLALLFGAALVPLQGQEKAVEFVTGYIIELSLSMDNVFVIALIFAYFRVPSQYQHRVLFWGIVGALVMRGVMIGVGVALIKQFQWLLYAFGAFLIFTGIKMLFADEEGVHPEKNPLIRLARKFFPVTTDFDGQKFFTRIPAPPGSKDQDDTVHLARKIGQFALTPLALVLLMVETTDLIFALDSIPAIFGVTQDPFIVFTSNVFAILGLRSLYFVLAGAIGYFRYLKYGLSLVLVFVGVKMMCDPHGHEPAWWQYKIPTSASLLIVAGIILLSVTVSIFAAQRERHGRSDDGDRGKPPPDEPGPVA